MYPGNYSTLWRMCTTMLAKSESYIQVTEADIFYPLNFNKKTVSEIYYGLIHVITHNT